MSEYQENQARRQCCESRDKHIHRWINEFIRRENVHCAGHQDRTLITKAHHVFPRSPLWIVIQGIMRGKSPDEATGSAIFSALRSPDPWRKVFVENAGGEWGPWSVRLERIRDNIEMFWDLSHQLADGMTGAIPGQLIKLGLKEDVICAGCFDRPKCLNQVNQGDLRVLQTSRQLPKSTQTSLGIVLEETYLTVPTQNISRYVDSVLKLLNRQQYPPAFQKAVSDNTKM